MSVLTPTVPAAAEDGPARVLIVGDSVTQGYKGDFTWRYFAWKGLASQGEEVDFVGPRSGTFFVHEDGAWDWDYTGEGAYADADFDRDHGAFYGGRMGPDDNFFYEPIGQEVASYVPDVVMSLWGINDLTREQEGPQDVIATYRDWVAEARASNPDVDFVLGRLPYVWIDEVPEFNDLLGTLATDLSTERSRIVVATMTEDYTQSGDSVDHVHPNTEGQRKIAGMMAGALSELLAAPTPEPETLPTPAPAPIPVPEAPPAPASVVAPVDVAEALSDAAPPGSPRRVKAVRKHGSRTVVTWRASVGPVDHRVRCGRVRTVATASKAVLRARSARCRVRAVGPGGRSPWVRVRVRER
ncbi:GDSL-type esterase/lipase family protein [Nocardia sp. N13]|uniref:GDSL-type esterase/lipase family protein n=1 Tax=Nocardioides sp. N13(2025) TaxID=3453405 RepID=UPI003F777086